FYSLPAAKWPTAQAQLMARLDARTPERPAQAQPEAADDQDVMNVQPKPEPAPAKAAPGASAPTVLLVDDEPALVRAYGRTLEQTGFSVSSAGNGTEATKLLQQRSFDVIISDIQMNGGGGLEFLRTVRQRDQDVPVVLMTGSP